MPGCLAVVVTSLEGEGDGVELDFSSSDGEDDGNILWTLDVSSSLAFLF